MLTRSISPADCQKEMVGRPKMTGMSQFHNSCTGQARANENNGHKTRCRSMMPRIRTILRLGGNVSFIACRF